MRSYPNSLVATPEDSVEGYRRAIKLATPPRWWGFYLRYAWPVHAGCYPVPTILSIVASLLLIALWIGAIWASDPSARQMARALLFVWLLATGAQSYEFSCRQWRLTLCYVVRYNVPLFHLFVRGFHEYYLVSRIEQGEWDNQWRLEDLKRALARKLERQGTSSS